ncbi:MAG TPA: cupin domain-containing protein [Streptosporangiaceae bacterium]|nr:cupin domain-containing protein [Streptosporangiaceae bacterium]
MRTYIFTDLVGDEREFFSNYFNVKPMLRKSSLPGDPRDILSIRQLDELVNLEVIRPPYIKANLNGSGVPEIGYTRNVVIQGVTVTDIVDPAKLYALYRAGATLTWCSLNHITPGLRAFTRMISDQMTVRTDSVAFLTPAGKPGYPVHHDPVDLFIVQLEGTKRWRLWDPGPTRHSTAEGYTEESLGEPSIQTELQPGDVMYLPYGTPHAAAAQEKASLHLSIMMRPRRWKDLLLDTVERVAQDPEFDSYPHLGEWRQEATEETFREKISVLAARLTGIDAAAELDRLAEAGRTMPGSSEGHTFQSITDADDLEPESWLRLGSAQVGFGENVNGRVEVTIDGGRIAIPGSVAELLATLSGEAQLQASEVIPGADHTRSVRAARALVKAGVLELVGER